jgi:hypothetical protein
MVHPNSLRHQSTLEKVQHYKARRNSAAYPLDETQNTELLEEIGNLESESTYNAKTSTLGEEYEASLAPTDELRERILNAIPILEQESK